MKGRRALVTQIPERSWPTRHGYQREWRRQGLHGDDTLDRALNRGVQALGEAEVVFHSSTRPATIRLREAYDQSRTVARALRALGIGPGDVVAVQVPNWLENMLIYQAVFATGAVLVPIIHIYGPREVGHILRSSGAKLFFCPDRWRTIDYRERLGAIGRDAVETVVIVGDDAPADTIGWRAFLALGAAAEPLTALDVHADDACVIIYTSGTTSAPKGVVHTHNSLIAANRMYEALSGLEPDAPLLGVGPAGHIGGVRNMLRVFLTGGKTILLDHWDAEAAARLVDEHGVRQIAGGTPYFLASLLDAGEALGVDLSRIARFSVGGASVPPALVERADRAGVRAGRVYGSTEVPSVAGYRGGDTLAQRAHTDGMPTLGARIRLLDEAGHDVAPGTSGEVALLAPFMFAGYKDLAADCGAFTPDGWFLSGDIGRFDADGHLSIVDRKKDIIIRGGENISSKEVEDVLATHPAVLESAATAMADEAMGEVVCAFVRLRDGGTLDLEAVRAHFRAAGIAKPKTPEHLVMVDDFPRTAAGKIKKAALRERLRGTSPAEGKSPSTTGIAG